MELIPHDLNIDFVGKRLFFVLFSAAINLASIVLMLTWGFNYGVDFAGGAVVEVRFPQPTTAETIRQSLGAAGMEDLTIQDLGGDSRTFLLHFKQMGKEMGEDLGDDWEELVEEAVREEAEGGEAGGLDEGDEDALPTSTPAETVPLPTAE